MSPQDYMHLAIQQARLGIQSQGMGFGAVVVKDGVALSATHNKVVTDIDPTSHGEVNAIREAAQKLGSPDLSGCVLYSTCEPCPMCLTAAWWANVSKVVFGVRLEDVTSVSKEMLVDAEFLNEKGGNTMVIEKDFMREECLKLYQ
jgi:guanine deaminase